MRKQRIGSLLIGGLRRMVPVMLLLACGPVLKAQEQKPVQGIRVPYGMAWGDTLEKTRDMIRAVKAQEISFETKALGKDVLVASGLAVGDQLLKKSLFTFRNGSLVEIELQYGDASWDAEKTLDFFDRTRRRINERYGVGTLLVNKVKEHPAGENVPEDMNYTLIVYEWSQPTVALELDYYAVEEKEKALRLVSLHYKMP
jgi:hypothetical protein